MKDIFGVSQRKKPFFLERESHQTRVEHNGQQHMTSHHDGEREDGCELGNVPAPRDEGADGHDDHDGNHEQAEEHRPLEALGDFGDFEEEVGPFDFFGSGTLSVALARIHFFERRVERYLPIAYRC